MNTKTQTNVSEETRRKMSKAAKARWAEKDATPGSLLTTRQVAALAKVEVSSIRTYRIRGTIPPPDVMVGVTPTWRVSTIKKWIATRPQRGRPFGS